MLNTERGPLSEELWRVDAGVWGRDLFENGNIWEHLGTLARGG
jgi:hypothetical protein